MAIIDKEKIFRGFVTGKDIFIIIEKVKERKMKGYGKLITLNGRWNEKISDVLKDNRIKKEVGEYFVEN